MTQLPLLDIPPDRPVTFNARLAQFFREHPREPIDYHYLDTHFGCGGWRTRVSQIRYPPYSMRIENKWWQERRPDGTPYRMSVYTYQPGPGGEA